MNYSRSNGWGMLQLQGLPFTGTGKVFVVGDSTIENRSMLQQLFGVDPDGDLRFFDDLDSAVGACTANAGDVIFVMPGHEETVASADAIDLDVAGISVIGLGQGSLRPKFTFSTAITARMAIAAANIRLQNVVLENGIDNLTNALHISAANAQLIDVETVDNDSNYHCDDFIVTTAAADGLRIKGWKHKAASGKTGAQTALSIVGGDDIEIDHVDLDGDFAVAAIENVTTAATNLKVGARSLMDNLLRTRNSADVLVTLVATSTGYVNNILGRLQDDAANITEALVGADMQFGNNLYLVNADGERAIQWNGTASADA